MFCTTTTPFLVEDVVDTLGKPTTIVETAWKMLQADFGAQAVFGCGRVEQTPNFYDVIAMAVLIAVLSKPVEAQFATALAIEIADETSLVLENSEDENTFSPHNQYCVLNEVSLLIDQCLINSKSHLDSKRKNDISASISSIFEYVRTSLALSKSYEDTPATSALKLTL